MTINTLIKDIEDFAEKIGMSPEYVCRKATNHFRLFERLGRRLEQLERDENRIRDFMASYDARDCSSTNKNTASALNQATHAGNSDAE